MKGTIEIRNSKIETNPKLESPKSPFDFRCSSLLRISDFGFPIFVTALAFFVQLNPVFAQRRNSDVPPPLSPAEGAREAQSLIAEMLAEKPEGNFTNSGLIKIRDADGN